MTPLSGNIFRVSSHLCGEFTGPRWNPRTKASEAELWFFSLICVWINGWVNNRKAGDLRRHRAHYDVSVMRRILPRLFCWIVSFHMTETLLVADEIRYIFFWTMWKAWLFETIPYIIEILSISTHVWNIIQHTESDQVFMNSGIVSNSESSCRLIRITVATIIFIFQMHRA